MASVVPAKWLDSHRWFGGAEDSRFLPFINRCLTIPRYLGIYCLKHDRDSSVPSPYLLAYNIVLMLFTVQTIVITAFTSPKFQTNIAYMYMNCAILSLSFFLCSYRVVKDCKYITSVFNSLQTSEKRLSSLGVFFSYGLPPILFCCLMLTFWVIQLAIFRYWHRRFRLLPSLIDYLKLLYIFNPSCFVALLHAIETQLANATYHLFWIAKSHMVRKKKIELLESFVEIHEELSTVSAAIGKLFSPQLLCTVTSAFIIFLMNAYRCFVEKHHRWIIIGYLLESLNGFLLVCMICSSSQSVWEQAKKFNTLLYQLMIDDKTNQISENKKLRLHISMKREVVFSACGFFNLDYTLIHSMVAAATTYLVILIQFGQPNNSSSPATTEHPNTTMISSSNFSNYFTTPSWMYTTLQKP